MLASLSHNTVNRPLCRSLCRHIAGAGHSSQSVSQQVLQCSHISGWEGGVIDELIVAQEYEFHVQTEFVMGMWLRN
jgi:hypothetical protein